MGIYKQHADNSGRRFITAFTVADFAAIDGDRISKAGAAAGAAKVHEFDFSQRDKRGQEMNAILKQCFQAQGADQADFLSTFPSADVRSNRYVCLMHPAVVQDAPGSYPKCSMKLLPIRE